MFLLLPMLLVQSAFSNSLHPLHPLGKYLMLETFVNVSAWLNRIDYWGGGWASWVKHTEIQQTPLGLWHIKNFSHHSLWGSLVPRVYYISWKYKSLWTIEKHFWRKNRNVNIYVYITKKTMFDIIVTSLQLQQCITVDISMIYLKT